MSLYTPSEERGLQGEGILCVSFRKQAAYHRSRFREETCKDTDMLIHSVISPSLSAANRAVLRKETRKDEV